MSSRPLDGVVVADLSRVLAGPLAAVMLADLGATVIKVERPGSGDDTRQWGPPWSGSSSSYFESANRSKQSIALDFADADDLAVAHRLVARADVVIENYRAGALARFGLDEATVREGNPRVVYTSISGFGSGAGADLPGYDFLVQAVGGLMSITGDPDGEPQKVGVALVDVLTAKDAVIGTLSALRHRDSTGLGQHVEVNLLSSLLGSLANQASAYLATGEAPARLGNRHPSIAPYDSLRCQDGSLAVACGNDRQWRIICEVIGAPQLADDPRFARNADRVAHHCELVAELETALAADTVTAWAERFSAAGIPAGKVNTIGEAIALARDLDLDPTVPVGEGHPDQLSHPIRYSAFRVATPRTPPALDADGDAVRAWLAQEQVDVRAGSTSQTPVPPGHASGGDSHVA
ncbi:CaiB/BaiF CoA transferase family protein [Microbacterium terricola]|uniref:CoA transferase n=1 Tax=Microbacterium terricola TaxID=344163 RepID=A0ABM8E2P1_9MICO|nr:CoA transferase [Microbacterium terricola]UYK40066.1 CoA transferase [Microbacterium terricola]BDV32237.1 CoA transferase [Microbacterium terricola]